MSRTLAHRLLVALALCSTTLGFLHPQPGSSMMYSSVRRQAGLAIAGYRLAAARSMPRWSKGMRMSTTDEPIAMTSIPSFEVTASSTAAKEWKGDLLVVPIFAEPAKEGGEEAEDAQPKLAILSDVASDLDGALDGAVSELVASDELKGNTGDSSVARLGSSALRRIAAVGLGQSSKMDDKAAASLGAAVAKLAKDCKCERVALALPEEVEGNMQGLLSGMMNAIYVDNRFRTGDRVEKPMKLTSIEILSGSDLGDVPALADKARGLASGINLCRDLVGAPANVLTPESMADVARYIAEVHGMEAEILEKDEILARGMGAYMGVAQGSVPGAGDPRFIHLTYKPKAGEVKKRLAVIGKGLTFDSGGYNLKAGAGSMIEMMKFDMGGAGATLGAAKAVGALQPEGVEVHFIVAACENMISDRAMRPGDILTASNGKTIEVINTDAEGRLTLADALVFAEKLEVDSIVDMATLTGACIISLGDKFAGLWSSDDGLAESLQASAKATGDKVWRMPLASEYNDQLKSKLADLKNVGGRAAGSITAALFLKEFVEKTPWAHIDIAGPVWDDKAGGATGYGVRLLVDWVEKQGA